MSFPRYPKYKDSGVEWLGEVPEHWACVRNKAVFREVDERSDTEDGELLTVSHITGVTPRSEKDVNMFLAETLVGYKRCRTGDLIINTMWAWMGALGCSRCDGLVSPAYNVYRLRKEGVLSPQFYDHLCRVPSHRTAMKARSTGVWESRLRLYPDAFLDMAMPLPPFEEQRAIASFLANETAKIDALITEQQRLVDLVDSQLKALALSAFDDPAAAFVRIGTVTDVISRPLREESGTRYTRLGLYNRGRGIFHKDPSEPEEMGDSDFFWVEEGDLILSGQFAWEGAVAIAGPEESRCVVSHRYPIVRGKDGVLRTEFLLSLLCTAHGDFLLNENSRGAAGRNRPLNLGSLLKEKIPIPDIALQNKAAQIYHRRQGLLKEIATQAALLQERRSALISAAVTGQIDVRGLNGLEAA